MLGVLAIVSTAAAGYRHRPDDRRGHGCIGGVLVALFFNLLLFFTAFRLLTSDEVKTRDLIPGVIVGAVLWQILQHVGGYYVDHVVRHAKQTSGLFAFVLGLLAWLYLGAQVTLVAAEVNVVRARRLWPRSFFSDPLLDADRRALTVRRRGRRSASTSRTSRSASTRPSSPRRARPAAAADDRSLALQCRFRDDLRSTCAHNHRALY